MTEAERDLTTGVLLGATSVMDIGVGIIVGYYKGPTIAVGISMILFPVIFSGWYAIFLKGR